jgi:hypothetical protein
MALILPSQSLVLNAYAVLVGETPGNASLNQHLTYINANGEAAYKSALNSVFANMTTAALATKLLTNLGLGSIFTQADAEAYLNANAANRVGAMMDLASQLYNYVGTNAALTTAAASYKNAVDGSYNYSINSANTNGTTLTGTVVSGGQTFTLTTATDNVTGTAGNDTINGSDTTLTGLDVISGGAGDDTLNIADVAGGLNTTLLGLTVSGIETANFRSTAALTVDGSTWTGLTALNVGVAGGAVALTTKGNATSATVGAGATTVAITDSATTDTLATVSVTGNTGATTVTSDALTSLSLANSAQNATVTAAAATRALALSVNTLTGEIGRAHV